MRTLGQRAMTIHLSQRAKDYFEAALSLLNAVHVVTNRVIAGQLKAHAEDYERRCAKLLRRMQLELGRFRPN